MESLPRFVQLALEVNSTAYEWKDEIKSGFSGGSSPVFPSISPSF
jgi:hypothetical protein